MPPSPTLPGGLERFLRSLERYTKTDMVYLFTSGFWMNLNFLFVSVFSFVLSIAFANLLTKTEFGTYQYLLAVSSILTAFTFTGFFTAITQSVARGYEGTFRASIKKQLLWNLLPATVALAWGSYYLVLGQNTLGLGLLCISVSLPVLNTANSYAAYLAGKQAFRTVSLYVMAGNAAYYLCIFLCVVAFPRALPLLFVNVLVTTGAAFFLYRRTLRKHPPKNDTEDPAALPYARHLTVMNVLGTVAARIDNLLVFHFLGAAPLALYSLAGLLPERLGGVFKAVTSAALPRFSTRSMQDVRDNFGRRTFIFFLGTLVMAGAYAWIAPYLFRLVYPAYSEAISYSQFYALTLVSSVGVLVNSALSAHRKIRELYLLNTVMPIAQIVIQIAGIVMWGLWGLIGAKILSVVVANVISLALFYSTPTSPSSDSDIPDTVPS